ncbi:Dihydrolipoyl dehydrogenase [Pseudolycoriella hygida]|uniref:Dihydrolipoyl dehydrogenase n=1 Tax=Pseudolycoriella hygida TaxID=35572 RepID=A0A9Q0N749_9DIPT|nr:Dihydrolipoyl dehydrogenase [Pseudolycoriella hygida]
MENYDVAVIGGGPGGYVAAIRAAQLNKKVVLIEREHLGGICLNWGCIPTKALLKSAELFQKIKHAEEYGIIVGEPQFDFKKIIQRSREISAQLTAGIKFLLKKNKVTLIDGCAAFETNKILNIDNKGQKFSIQADNIIIATGARARSLEGFITDGKQIITSKEAMILDKLPKSLIIVGSGAIGIEFASFYNALGTKVIILEAKKNILQSEDAEISSIVKKIFTKKGIIFYTNVKLLNHTKQRDHLTIEVEIDGVRQQLSSEILLMAIGIVGNTEHLNLERTKIQVEKGHIVTNQFMETSQPGIYAIGNVTAPPWLAHKASHEGIIAAETIAGLKAHPINKQNIAGCTYSFPQIASVGLTEEKAKNAGYDIKIGKFPASANGKALIDGDSEGLIKTIFDAKTGELLGAHLIGTEVTELIQGYVINKTMEGTEADLINTIFPHPTLSEMMGEAVLQAYGRALHIISE